MAAAQRGQHIVIADDGAGMAHRQLRRFFGTPEMDNQHRNRAPPGLFQRGYEGRRIAHRLEQDRNDAGGFLLKQIVHVVADAGIDFLGAGNYVVEAKARIVVGEVSHAGTGMRQHRDMPRGTPGRRFVETDEYAVVVVVKTHRVTAANRDSRRRGALPQTFGQRRLAIFH